MPVTISIPSIMSTRMKVVPRVTVTACISGALKNKPKTKTATNTNTTNGTTRTRQPSVTPRLFIKLSLGARVAHDHQGEIYPQITPNANYRLVLVQENNG